MRRRLILLAGVLVVALIAAGTVGATLLVINDATGDSTSAPDISQVTVDNDAANNITFQVKTNLAALTTDTVIFVVIDADNNTGTGPGGIDYIFALDSGGYAYIVFNGSAFVDAPNTTVHVLFGNGTATFVVNKSELGNANSFMFSAQTLHTTGDNVDGRDQAPDSGFASYTLSVPAPATTTTTTTTAPPPPPPPPPPTIALGTPSAKAPGIHAGKAFTITDRVATDAKTVRVTCTARIGTRIVRALGHYLNHVASCTGVVPARTAGKRLSVTMTGTITGDKEIKSASFVVRR
jgi:hypothetical protein